MSKYKIYIPYHPISEIEEMEMKEIKIKKKKKNSNPSLEYKSLDEIFKGKDL